tara:strand:+ start:1457 stop:2290 length:834 start_codon:yes stop_codon:yes gene_type:complete
MENQNNPLVGYFRKPEVYVELPSRGNYYKPGILDLPPNGEVGIFPMTARDELVLKTPDALLNGASTVEVIKSCVPAINDPWEIPSIDMDPLLIGVRIATYGENMDITIGCGECQEKNEFTVDLTNLMDQVREWKFEEHLQVDDLNITFRPLTYKELNSESLRQFEETKILRIVNDEKIDEEKKRELFQESFLKLTGLTVDIIGKTIKKVESPKGTTEDPRHIAEFIQNIDRKTFSAIQDHLDVQKKLNSFKPFKGKCNKCSKDLETPIMFDNANFFA